jgi:hypothetical protein
MTEKDQDIERALKFYIRTTWADSTCVPLLEHTSLLCAEKLFLLVETIHQS